MLHHWHIAIFALILFISESWEFPERKATPSSPENSLGIICNSNSKNIDFSVKKCNHTDKKILKIQVRESDRPTNPTTVENPTEEPSEQSEDTFIDYDYLLSSSYEYDGDDYSMRGDGQRSMSSGIPDPHSKLPWNMNMHRHRPPWDRHFDISRFRQEQWDALHAGLGVTSETTTEQTFSYSHEMKMNTIFCTEAKKDQIDTKIPDGDFHPNFEMIAGLGFYRFHATPRSWEDARRVCEAEDAHLAVPNSQEEALAVQEIHKRCPFILNTHFNDYQYVGIHDRFSEGHWETVFDEPLDKTGYVNWAFNQPDNAHHLGENCLCMNRKGYYNDVPCWTKLPFTCEHN